MQDNNQNLSEIEIQNQKIIDNKELNLYEALIPVVILMAMLAYNIFFAGGELLGEYSNQFILLMGGLIASIVGFLNKVSFKLMIAEIWENLKSVFIPIMILFLVGALAGTWLVSGIIPAMVYYGLQVLSPAIFLPASVIIAAIISMATGSSWTTSATVGIALVGIGTALGIPTGMIAGAVISGAYFGDKMSPLSDTTNLAPAMAGTDLFTHIRYMTITTVPSIVVTIIIFGIISLNIDTTGTADNEFLLQTINTTFNITPWLFLVPLTVIGLIFFKTKPLIALGAGVVLALVFTFIFQIEVINKITSSKINAVANSVLSDVSIKIDDEKYFNSFDERDNEILKNNEYLNTLFNDKDLEKNFSDGELKELFKSQGLNDDILTSKVENLDKLIVTKRLKKLFSSGGMKGMLWTIFLICCAMVFGGTMDAIGALAKITKELLKVATSIFGLFVSTVVSCIGLNAIASDQYLAIVIPGKMFKKAFEDKELAPENLSRTLEDSGTVTSALIPWNTCGAYQSGVLGVSVGDYFVYAIFNWLSPFMTLIFAAFSIKIKMLKTKTT
ncbi:MAG: sodium:proton antiporter [Bacteroidetes bacterium HGW-Bacteroidetes-2]|jgi:NhaC family Na+:H+ antiporter|nr:MAG: sodium:proton antiporter [Bacteroidetes bacterium HGW-Bacteroidetes-2]